MATLVQSFSPISSPVSLLPPPRPTSSSDHHSHPSSATGYRKLSTPHHNDFSKPASTTFSNQTAPSYSFVASQPIQRQVRQEIPQHQAHGLRAQSEPTLSRFVDPAPTTQQAQPQSIVQTPNMPENTLPIRSKQTPDRYRKPFKKGADSSESVPTLGTQTQPTISVPEQIEGERKTTQSFSLPAFSWQKENASSTDGQTQAPAAKPYGARSDSLQAPSDGTNTRTWASVAAQPYSIAAPPPAIKQQNNIQKEYVGQRPASGHGRQDSADSILASRQRPAELPQQIPPRTPPSTQPGRLDSPSSASPALTKVPESAAAQRLTALNQKENKKESRTTSRFRRAFSFGSAAELKKAAEQQPAAIQPSAANKLRKDKPEDELEAAREAAIVQRQEAGGLGASIYSGQGNFYTGSTDNLSVSSTASSASIMLRKMGQGMKKGTRSLVGLFRPKSVIGVPAADGPVVQPSVAQVSMVTVEAERERVNVNADVHDQTRGGTGFPKLERNSLDAGNAGMHSSPARDDSFDMRGRQSIMGGDKERADVLAAVKKGILKRNGTDSANGSPARGHAPTPLAFTPPSIPGLSQSAISSRDSSPASATDRIPRGHRRTESVANNDDYFNAVSRFPATGNKSLPGTPRSTSSRNISFSPRIQFHDTWPSIEYDRRGEIATCNRLTPLLAQQIKEELNTFKMEMEVHESSKIYTHFF